MQERFLVTPHRPGALARAALCTLLIFVGAGPLANMARAADVDPELTAALADYQAGNLLKARQEFDRAAQHGEPVGEFNLSSMMVQGQGGPVRARLGRYWLNKAARAGLAQAQYALGVLYDRGDGVPRSASVAAHWYRLAAEQGDIDAAMTLATQYFVGRGVPLDYSAAAHWYELAAQAGVEPAQFILASCYEHGDGVPRDTRRAIYWYRLAGNAGDALAADKARTLDQAQGGTADPG
jgi:TPR repeat protein